METNKKITEDTVEIKGVVKIDTSDELKNLYEIARRAKDANNSEKAEKYYDMILIKDPNSWEAAFYVAYFGAMSSKVEEISRVAERVYNSYPSLVDLLKQYLEVDELPDVIKEISERLNGLSRMLFNASVNTYKSISIMARSQFSGQFTNHAFCATKIILFWGDSLYDIDKEKYKSLILDMWKTGVDDIASIIKAGLGMDAIDEISRMSQQYRDRISQMDSSYVAQKSGCYVATAVYSSYDCPEVWTLRRYRDFTLNETWYGRLFIKAYYATSPTFVRYFGNAKTFKTYGKKLLDRIVARLNRKGYDNSPYKDNY